jgi:hypothetical protein
MRHDQWPHPLKKFIYNINQSIRHNLLYSVKSINLPKLLRLRPQRPQRSHGYGHRGEHEHGHHGCPAR